ncbi:MAG: DUF547 domain-containing protein [Candidatus Latescibacteria bacterium]|nr:DUF547 domain-containing protein [Candidatus Latescibacterota bacterium]
MPVRLLAALFLLVLPAGATPFPHALLDQVLRTHVDAAGRVDYAALKQNPALLDTYLDSLGQCSPHRQPGRFPTPRHELAYWINAYNALVLRGVVDGYPVSRVDELGGIEVFFRQRLHTLGGEQLTLDQLESQIIRPEYRDPRIHFALNCGALGCPALLNRAYTGEALDSLLDSRARHFAADSSQVHLDLQAGKLLLSQVLNWYGEDFTRWFPTTAAAPPAPTLVDYLLLYLPQDQAARWRQHPGLEIVFSEYDWTLNDRPPLLK